MRKVDAAQWLLSLTTTPERAASTAGDLAEEYASRGLLWFWWSLLGTATSLIWTSFAESPMKLTGLAVRTLLRSALYFFLADLGIMLVFATVVIAVMDGPHGTEDLIMDLWWIAGGLAVLLSSILLGKWLARTAASQELAVWVLSGILGRLVWGAILLTAPTLRSAFGYGDVILDVLVLIGTTVCLFAGIARMRSQSAVARLSRQP
jgi:hypothetical protein